MGLVYVNQVGAPEGLNQAAPAAFIPDTFVRWSQDILFDQTGYLRRRNPFKFFKLYDNGTPPSEHYPDTADERVIGVASTLNPAGSRVTAVVVSTDSNSRILFYNEDFQAQYNFSASPAEIISSSDLTPGALIPNEAICDFKSASNGGMWLSFLESYKAASGSNEYYQYFWYGGAGKEQEITNVDLAKNGTTYLNYMTGSFNTTTITPGMFVYVLHPTENEYYYIGTISAVSDTQLTLLKDIVRFGKNVNISSSSAYWDNVKIKVMNVRPYIHVHGRGLITKVANSAAVTSGLVGTEGEGHFLSADIDSNWAIYRASDGEWLGDVDTADSNTGITLNNVYHSSTVAMQAEEYVARKYTPVPTATVADSTSTDFAGIFNATYAGYQWYGNAGNSEDKHRVVFSAYHDAEAVDLSMDAADSINIPGTSEMRGMAASSAGLVVFMTDKTYIIRGNYRSNFSLEELYPEGCLSTMSIVEMGGGVFWASRIGLMYFDGASVRNLTENNLGAYYTDAVRAFDVQTDRVYGVYHKNYLLMHFTSFSGPFNPLRYEPVYADGIETTPAISDFTAAEWDAAFTVDDFNVTNNVPIYWTSETLYNDFNNSTGIVPIWGGSSNTYVWGDEESQYVWGPLRQSDGMTFALYVPSNAITTLSNFGFRGAAKLETVSGIKSLMGVNMVSGGSVYPRLIDLDTILAHDDNTDISSDEGVIEILGKAEADLKAGPDFYMETKQFTVGDPILKKWFRQLFLNMYLIDGGMRVDIIDSEDNDRIDVQKKKHKNWEIFMFNEGLYTWNELETIIFPRRLSPNRSTWANIEALNSSWYALVDSQFERRKMKFSWRYPSLGFRLYQMNRYRPGNYQSSQRPYRVKVDAWTIGFKSMRQSRV